MHGFHERRRTYPLYHMITLFSLCASKHRYQQLPGIYGPLPGTVGLGAMQVGVEARCITCGAARESRSTANVRVISLDVRHMSSRPI